MLLRSGEVMSDDEVDGLEVELRGAFTGTALKLEPAERLLVLGTETGLEVV